MPAADGFHVEFVSHGGVVGRRIGDAELVGHADAEAVVAVRIQIADVAAASAQPRTHRLPLTVRAFAHLHLGRNNYKIKHKLKNLI